MAARTLVVMPNWVGDCVMALPALSALAAAQRDLVLLARPHLGSLLRLSAVAREIVERAASDTETVARVRASACDEAVVLPNSFRSAWLVQAAGIRHRWGYRGNWRTPLLEPAVPRPRGRRPQIEDYRELLDSMAVPPPPSWVPQLPRSPALLERGRERLRRAHLADTQAPLIGLSAGAEWGPSKRWPWRRFADLARALRRELPASGQVIVAGPKDVWTAVRIHEESGKLHPVIGPDLDLAGLAALLANLQVLVTNDSGPMHLAAALGVPCVALFGPTDPRRTAPAGGTHQVLHRHLWCSPCFSRHCPLLHQRCLRGVGVEAVLAAVLAALGRPAA